MYIPVIYIPVIYIPVIYTCNIPVIYLVYTVYKVYSTDCIHLSIMCEIYLAQNIEHRTVKRFNSFYLTIQLKYFFVLIFLCIFFFCLKKRYF